MKTEPLQNTEDVKIRRIRIVHGCHGIPERCLTVRGRKMKICARCFGARLGNTAALIACVAQCLTGSNLVPPWWISMLLPIPMVLDGGLQAFGGIMSNNTRRAITGVLAGFGIGALFWGTIAFVEQQAILWYIYN